jgi:hypothetical protein
MLNAQVDAFRPFPPFYGGPHVNKLLFISAAVAAIAANAATTASAQTVAYTQNPVHVVRYSVQSAYLPSMPVWGGTSPGVASYSELAITFVNTGAVPATAVRFAVHTGTTTEIIADNGTFSPGTGITHDFPIGSAFGGAATVEVQSVTFADGTSWSRG